MVSVNLTSAEDEWLNVITNELFWNQVESESGFDTKKVNPYPPIPGSHPPIHQSYGIFQVNKTCVFFHLPILISIIFCVFTLRRQINSKTYCGKGYPGGKCKVRCEGMYGQHIHEHTHFTLNLHYNL